VRSAPLISIVTPCRDAARHLPRALESVARGSAGAVPGTFEHIIMDGGSRDGSPEQIRRHAAAHPQLIAYWESRPDRGQADAINRGLARARGTYGAWLNADDWYVPGALESLAERLVLPDAPDVLVGRCRFVDEAGQTVMEPRPPSPLSLASLLRLRTQWFNGRCLVQPEVFFSLEWFKRVGGLDPSNHYTMDHDLWCRLLQAGARFECVDIPVACAGVHAGQKTRNNREVARSILRHSLAIARGAAAPNGGDEQTIAELEAVESKLHATDAIIRWWRTGLDPRAQRQAVRAEDQPLPPAGSGEAMELAAAAAARALRWKPRLKVGLVECDPHIAPRVTGALGWHWAELHIASSSKLALAQTSGALRSRRRSGAILGHLGSLTSGSFDLIVVQSVSIRQTMARSVVADLWSRLSPGGVLVQVDDPLASPALLAYIDFLSVRLGDNITADHDILLHPSADGFLRNLIGAARPAAIAGLDPHEMIPRLSATATCLFSRPMGTCEDHPMTGFVPLGPPEVSGFPSWITSAWRKV
jgi:hypothetical protein